MTAKCAQQSRESLPRCQQVASCVGLRIMTAMRLNDGNETVK